ncbi:MAG: glycosyl hydrolase family 31, partial [Bacteroidales bacterium]|nr:glycosyl hydrolase family 31 [Bacteroidales bacterium]
MKKIVFTLLSAVCLTSASAQRLYITPLDNNATRVRYSTDSISKLPELVYLPQNFNAAKSLNVNEIKDKIAAYSLSGDTAFASFKASDDEFLFGLGQFQDGYSNLNGLPRRLTQVNTQISMPVLISNKGYGIVWNNYSKTEFNLPKNKVELKKTAAEGAAETVNVTTTEGGRQETRHKNIFEAEI